MKKMNILSITIGLIIASFISVIPITNVYALDSSVKVTKSFDGDATPPVTTNNKGNTKTQTNTKKKQTTGKTSSKSSTTPASNSSTAPSSKSSTASSSNSDNKKKAGSSPIDEVNGSQVYTQADWAVTEGWTWDLSEWANRGSWEQQTSSKAWYNPANFSKWVKTVLYGSSTNTKTPAKTSSSTKQTKKVKYVTVKGKPVTVQNNVKTSRVTVRYDWNLKNTTTGVAKTTSTPKLHLTWTFTTTGDYVVTATPYCSWQVGKVQQTTNTTYGSNGSVTKKTTTKFVKTGVVYAHYLPGEKTFKFKIGLGDINKPTPLPPPNQVQVDTIDEVVE